MLEQVLVTVDPMLIAPTLSSHLPVHAKLAMRTLFQPMDVQTLMSALMEHTPVNLEQPVPMFQEVILAHVLMDTMETHMLTVMTLMNAYQVLVMSSSSKFKLFKLILKLSLA